MDIWQQWACRKKYINIFHPFATPPIPMDPMLSNSSAVIIVHVKRNVYIWFMPPKSNVLNPRSWSLKLLTPTPFPTQTWPRSLLPITQVWRCSTSWRSSMWCDHRSKWVCYEWVGPSYPTWGNTIPFLAYVYRACIWCRRCRYLWHSRCSLESKRECTVCPELACRFCWTCCKPSHCHSNAVHPMDFRHCNRMPRHTSQQEQNSTPRKLKPQPCCLYWDQTETKNLYNTLSVTKSE